MTPERRTEARHWLLLLILSAALAGILLWIGLPAALLLGPMIYRHVFVRKLGQKLPENLEVAVADAFLAAFGTAKAFGTGKQKATRH